MFRSVLLFLTLTFATLSSAQAPASPSLEPNPKAINKPDNAQEGFIVEQELTSETYEADGTGVIETTSRVRLQSEAGVQQFGLLQLAYEKNFHDANFDYVRVHKSDGSLINTPLDEVQDIEAEITRVAPFYSDLREKHIAVKGLGVGDVLEWRTVTHVTKALVPGEFWTGYSFAKNAVMLNEELRFSVPKDLYVKIKSNSVQPSVREEGGRRVYEWKRAQLKREDEDLKLKFGPPFKEPPADVEISTFKSWNEVGNWYAQLQKDRVSPSPEVKNKALELTKNAKTDDEKIRILYDFVATHFRYIGVAFGIGRYQPHAAGDVLDNSYGDCKDKHTLLAALLQAAGIDASAALINSTHDIDSDVPSPGQFDHVITAVRQGKQLLWLDTTTEVAPYGVLLANLRDKQALVISVDGSSSLIKTPEKPPFDQFDTFVTDATLADNGELKAHMQDETRGDSEVLLRSVFHQVAQAQWKDLVQQISYRMGFAGTVSDVSAGVPEKTAEPFHFSYSYDRTEYSDWVSNKRITVPCPPLAIPALNDEYEKSREPVRLGSPQRFDYISDVKFPDGYSVQLPDNVDFTTDFAEYHANYSIRDGKIHADRQLTVLAKEVPPAEYAKYQEFQRKVSDDYGTWVTFTSTTRSASPSPQSSPVLRWPPPPDTDAGHEYTEAVALLQQTRYREGLDKLEEAANRDPKLPGVWDMIASIYWMRGDRATAIADVRRQATETPDIALAHKVLATMLLQDQKKEEALPALQRWMELAPEDTDAERQYGSTLITLKKYDQAIELFTKAVKENPKKDLFQFQLGSAYLASGDTEKGFDHYKQGLSLTENKESWENEVSYALAEKAVHLDSAEEWATDAVRKTEEATQKLDLSQLERKDLTLMNELSMYWDTLGWIYFHKREYAKAEPYISSSWWLRQNSIVGDHLAQVYEKLHEPAKASRFRQLADATPDKNGQPLTPEQAMRGIKSSWKRGEWDPREELGKMRTVHVSENSSKSESAEFFVLLSNASAQSKNAVGVMAASAKASAETRAMNVESVKFVSGEESLKKAQTSLSHADFGLHLPADANVKLLRRGILMCSPYTKGCDFTMMTADSVRSLN